VNFKLFPLSLTALILISVSCLSYVDSTTDTVRAFSAVETVKPEWQSLANGVDYLHGKINSPRMEFWAARIDLNAPDVSIVINSDAGTVSDFVRSNNLIMGINASPFDENRKNMGLVVSGGSMINNPVSRYDALVFYKNGQAIKAEIVSQADFILTANINNAVGGYHRILDSANPAPRTFREGTVSAQRHPRSAAGISHNGSMLYLLVIDGRRSGSTGATELETALLLHALGSTEGINLDGGGSSTLAIRYRDGTVRAVNTPGGLGRERPVAGCIGINLSTEK
jgi:exopolysaccharide biosynthesis protein